MISRISGPLQGSTLLPCSTPNISVSRQLKHELEEFLTSYGREQEAYSDLSRKELKEELSILEEIEHLTLKLPSYKRRIGDGVGRGVLSAVEQPKETTLENEDRRCSQ